MMVPAFIGSRMSAAQPWTPAQLSLYAWYRGQLISGSDGAAISSIPDSSGNSRTITATVNATLRTSVQGGKNFVEMSRTSRLAFTSAASGGTQPWSYFMVNKRTTNDNPARVLHRGTNEGFWFYENGNNLKVNAGSGGPGVVTTMGNFCLHYASANGASSVVSVNGATPTTGNAGTSNPANANVNIGPAFGSSIGAVHQWAEILIINSALTTTERQKLEGWAAWEYSLTSLLDSGHPYKLSAPTL